MTGEIETTTERVVVDQPETMNLLGLLMHGLLRARLENRDIRARALATKGDLQVQAGRMVVTLRFGPDCLTILCGSRDKPRARVTGGMAPLLDVVTGRALIRPLLAGRIRIGGNPLFLLRLLPLLRAPRPRLIASDPSVPPPHSRAGGPRP